MSSPSSNTERTNTTTLEEYSTIVLAVETSCDETAISIVGSSKKGLKILSNQVSSQIKLHAKWGGVVPNLAAREHVKNIDLMLKTALKEAGVGIADIDAIAVTHGPGLIPALLVGTNYAKTLSYLWNKPLIGIHHIEGHIYANFIGISNDKFQISNENADKKNSANIEFPISKQIPNSKSQCQNKKTSYTENCELKIENSDTTFPILCLVVSGGHTQLVLMKDHFDYEIIGQTVDDAVGEAFDKVARILGIGYPGGPAVAQWANKFQDTSNKIQTNSKSNELPNEAKEANEANEAESYKLVFPRPMLNKRGYNFSFSGLKTAVLYETKKHPELMKDKKYISQICKEFQQACVDVLVSKTIKAAKQYDPKTILIAGGVSANMELRKQLGEAIAETLPGTSYMIPDASLTGDNAAMIGAAGAMRWEKMTDQQRNDVLENWSLMKPDANLKMK